MQYSGLASVQAPWPTIAFQTKGSEGTAMNRKPTNIRRLVTAVLTSGLLMVSASASSDHERHTNDIAEGLLAGAIAALTIGIILQEIDGRVDGRHERHYTHRPPPIIRPCGIATCPVARMGPTPLEGKFAAISNDALAG